MGAYAAAMEQVPSSSQSRTAVVDVARALAAAARGGDGAVWSFETDDLDANLVRLGPSGAIGEHRNDEVDVVIVVLGGNGVVTIDDARHDVGSQTLLCVPRATTRGIVAGDDGLVYVTVHRRRRGLGISGSRGASA
jgi:quercetin dioxygenase-like cupin family protein